MSSRLQISPEELHEHTAEVLERVAGGDTFEILADHRVLAKLVPPGANTADEPEDAELLAPTKPVDPAELAAWWAGVKALGEEIAAQWPAGVSAVDAVREQRREL